MADDTGVSRRALREKELKERQEQAGKDREKLVSLINSVARTDDGMAFIKYVLTVTGVGNAQSLMNAVTQTGAVDPFLAGYTMGRKSLGEHIMSVLTPENLIIAIKETEE
ncbi:MAG: hypothetical protein EOL91_08235 [Actinobacteria bacterium]|nr:hypothetical protein [Actinomycetota bacterium]